MLYPPVDTEFYRPDGRSPGSGVLVVSALVPYKRIDLAVAACREARVPLRIVGQGPEMTRLRRQAGGADVEFLGAASDEDLRELYRQAAVVMLPGEEDFGIVPVEALACGRPVVALGRGGAAETVEDGVTGVLVPDADAGAFADGLRRALDTRFDESILRQRAEAFGLERFAAGLASEIDDMLAASAEHVRW